MILEDTQKVNPLGVQPIPKLLWKFAVPAVAANVMNALYNIVDQIFIGQGVGFLGNAATNIAFPITTLCLAIGLMTGIGSASAFNLELGRRNPEKARKIVGSAVSMLLICGLLICLLVKIFLRPLMIAFGATDQILAYSMEYATITSYGIPFLLISLGLNPLVRGDGSPKYSMGAIMTGAILNTILDPIFIFVFDWGIAGAAWATVISQVISAIILLLYLRRFQSVHFERSDFIPRFSYILHICYLGIASFIFQGSTMVIQIVTNNLLKFYGASSIYGSDIPIAVAGIVMKINVIFVALVIGVVQGSQPINGFNYGAQKYDRVRATMRLLMKTTFVISLVLFAIFQIFPTQLISLFGNGDQLYFEFGRTYLRTFLFFVFLNGIQISIATFFPSIGKGFKGALLSLSKQMIFLLPLLLILPRYFGVKGIIYATPISDVLSFLLAIVFLAHEFKHMPKISLAEEDQVQQPLADHRNIC